MNRIPNNDSPQKWDVKKYTNRKDACRAIYELIVNRANDTCDKIRMQTHLSEEQRELKCELEMTVCRMNLSVMSMTLQACSLPAEAPTTNNEPQRRD